VLGLLFSLLHSTLHNPSLPGCSIPYIFPLSPSRLQLTGACSFRTTSRIRVRVRGYSFSVWLSSVSTTSGSAREERFSAVSPPLLYLALKKIMKLYRVATPILLPVGRVVHCCVDPSAIGCCSLLANGLTPFQCQWRHFGRERSTLLSFDSRYVSLNHAVYR